MLQRKMLVWFLVGVTAVLAACERQVTAPPAALATPPSARKDVGSHLGAGTTVVKPSDTHGWYFWNDKNDSFTGSPGEFTTGPATPPMGSGSVRLGPLTDDGTTAAGHSVIATNEFFGVKLSNITTLSYSTYQSGPTLAIAMQFDVRYRTTDASYGGRLVYEPYQNGAVAVGSGWQPWSPLAGRWWASKTSAAGTGGAQVVALPAGNCGQSTPCTWAEILAAFPDAVIAGRFLFKAGSNWNGFDGNVDGVTVGVNGSDAVFDFEAEIPCTTVCYADAASGNDLAGGGTPATAKKTIQAAINAVSANGTVRVLPGTYNEIAPNSTLATGGTYQFGLFFGAAKPGVTLMGVTAADVPITSASATLATINTDATNNFGPSDIFVEAANVTIRGVTIGANASGYNKTVEVIGDNFTLQYVTTALPPESGGGSIYINDFSADGSVVKAYHVLDNRFLDGTSVDISSGAGYTGPVSGREILRNQFDLQNYGFNGVSFNGTLAAVPWFVNPVGGAIIKNNSFKNSTQYIRARGTYDNAQFDWASYFNDNTFDRATVALITQAPFNVRTYASGVSTNARRVGGTIQEEVDLAVANDIVKAKAGTYAENVVINKAGLKLLGSGIDISTIIGPKGTAGGTTLQVPAGSTGALIDGFTVTRDGNTTADWNGALNNQGVALYATGSTLQNSKVTGNRNGVFVYGATNVSVLNNIIDFNRTGLHLVNDVTGLVVRNNFITNNWTMGVLFRDEALPNATGAVTIQDNSISGNWYSQVEGRSKFSAPALNVSGNWLGTNAPTVFVGPAADAASGSGEPGYAAQIPVLFGGAATPPPSAPTIVYNGLNASNPVNYVQFRCTGTDGSAALGFQPSGPLSVGGACPPPPPVVAIASPDLSVNEGQLLTTSGKFTGTGLTITANNVVGTFTPNNAAGTWTWSYPTTDNLPVTKIVVTAKDGFVQIVADTFTYQAANVAPSATFNAPSSVNEGASFTISLSSPTDPSSVDAAAGFTYAFNCGAGYGAFSSSTSRTCTAPVAVSLAVKGTIRDKNGGTREYTATVNVLNSKQVKTNVRNTLAALLPTGSRTTDDALRRAIAHLDRSLASYLWADGSHLTRRGDDVFSEEEAAVEDLVKIRSGPAAATVAQAMLALALVDKELAQTAIDEATSSSRRNAAQVYMSKAAYDMSHGDYDGAIEDYRRAWKVATGN